MVSPCSCMKKRKTRHIRFPLSPQHCCVLQAHPSLRSSVGAGSPGDRKDSGNPTTKLYLHQHFLKPLMLDYVGDTMWGNLLGREASSAGLSIPCSVYLTLPNIGFRLLETSSWTEMDVISWALPGPEPLPFSIAASPPCGARRSLSLRCGDTRPPAAV